jgi:hypothetical protein
MGGGAVATTGAHAAYGHLLDPNRKWYNNRRYGFFLFQLADFSDARVFLESSPSMHGSSYCKSPLPPYPLSTYLISGRV